MTMKAGFSFNTTVNKELNLEVSEVKIGKRVWFSSTGRSKIPPHGVVPQREGTLVGVGGTHKQNRARERAKEQKPAR